MFYYFRISPSSDNISSQVKPHFKEFLTQAKARGIEVNINNLSNDFVNGLKDEEGNPVFGKYTHWFFPIPLDIIKLDTMGFWWRGNINRDSKDYIKYSREKVIFHELGHFVLNRRENKFGTFPGGLPKSIMGIAYIPSYEQYPYIRKYYLDELFNHNTPAPYWLKNEKWASNTSGNQEINKVSKV